MTWKKTLKSLKEALVNWFKAWAARAVEEELDKKDDSNKSVDN